MVETRHGPTIEELRARRSEIIGVAAENGAATVRILGSVARGEANAASDIDLLIDIVADAHGFAYFAVLEKLRRALTDLLGQGVGEVDSAALRRMKKRVLHEAVAL